MFRMCFWPDLKDHLKQEFTVFRLTSNLCTKTGLTNGTVGRIHAIIYSENQQPPSLPAGIIATFDDYKGPPFLPNLVKSVPIVPVRRDWHANKIHCTRTMLPIILGNALSIHKLQGSTCEQVIQPREKGICQ
jgi:hypothetical protein